MTIPPAFMKSLTNDELERGLATAPSQEWADAIKVEQERRAKMKDLSLLSDAELDAKIESAKQRQAIAVKLNNSDSYAVAGQLINAYQKEKDRRVNIPQQQNVETKPRQLEQKTCYRCGGTGHYSYNQRHGTVCYGCGGRKTVLTKRGQAAADYLKKLRSRRLDQLEVGQWFQYHALTLGGDVYWDWFQVEKIEKPVKQLGSASVNNVPLPRREDCVTLHCKGKISGPLVLNAFAPETEVRVYVSKAEDQRTLRLALDYQDTLNCLGKPDKRKIRDPLS